MDGLSRYARSKMWVKRNQNAIILVTASTLVIGLAVVGIKADMAFRENVMSELNDHIDQLNALTDVEAL